MRNLLIAQERLARLLAQGQISDSTAERMLSVLKERHASNPRPQLFNQRQASRFLGVSEQSMRRWTKEGIVPFVQIGKSRWFRPGDLEAFTQGRVIRSKD